MLLNYFHLLNVYNSTDDYANITIDTTHGYSLNKYYELKTIHFPVCELVPTCFRKPEELNIVSRPKKNFHRVQTNDKGSREGSSGRRDDLDENGGNTDTWSSAAGREKPAQVGSESSSPETWAQPGCCKRGVNTLWGCYGGGRCSRLRATPAETSARVLC